MGDYKHILFSTDFSKNADRAFEDASRLAAMGQGRLTILHVVEDKRMLREIEAQVRDYLQNTYGAHLQSDFEIVILSGDAAEEIIKYSEAHDADMIVLGARGMGRLSGLLGLGSVAEKVISNARVPVVLVPKFEYEDYRDRAREELARRRGIPLRTDVGRVLREIEERERKGK